ncbi:MAG: ABC transporter ATP-binding protein [Firmicutes bacterium]|nr:ABC transporter ATP-binding protein [Bacillota bacterium]
MAKLILDNLNKSYGNFQALKNFSLTIEDGELIVIVGPSGCGKTTVLRIIAGLLKQDSGKIMLDSNDISDMAAYKRNVSMMFQSYALFDHMNCFDNIAYGLHYLGYSKQDINNKVNDIAKMLNIDTLLKRKPSMLSGGQKQRIALARCLVRDAKVLLMDEPLSALDTDLKNQMRFELKQMQRKLNKTMIYVTHDWMEAMTLADRIVVMKDGMIMQIDEPLSLYRYPNNLFVADFVKGINIIDGQIIDDHFVFNDQKIALLEHFDNMKASIGIRSEDIILNGDIDVTVDEYEYLGDETIIHARMDGIRIKIKSLTYLNADKLKIGFDNSKLLIFDENGNLLRKDRSI